MNSSASEFGSWLFFLLHVFLTVKSKTLGEENIIFFYMCS